MEIRKSKNQLRLEALKQKKDDAAKLWKYIRLRTMGGEVVSQDAAVRALFGEKALKSKAREAYFKRIRSAVKLLRQKGKWTYINWDKGIYRIQTEKQILEKLDELKRWEKSAKNKQILLKEMLRRLNRRGK